MQELRLAYASLDTSTLTTVAMAIAGLAMAHVILSWCIKYKARRESASQQPMESGTQAAVRHWIWRGAIRCIRPLAVLIWVNGLHFVLTIVAADLDEYALAAAAIDAIDWSCMDNSCPSVTIAERE